MCDGHIEIFQNLKEAIYIEEKKDIFCKLSRPLFYHIMLFLLHIAHTVLMRVNTSTLHMSNYSELQVFTVLL